MCTAVPLSLLWHMHIDHLIQLNLGSRITSLNVHRLLITTVMLASKFLDDLNYNNAYYAKVGSITTKHINSLEMEFLFMLDFRLHETVSVFESCCAHLEREVALAGGYQIEITLRCICGMDEGSTRDDSQKEGLSFRCSSRGPYMTSVAAMRNFMEMPVAHTIFDVSHWYLYVKLTCNFLRFMLAPLCLDL
eukprot:Gb_11201 [translate_table: standard]